ncbi:MAG: hypothetical protein H0X62_12630 [Bacteroidetes bacterium]|nr:hypothetical protein [Bacteroidota bacterium]
MFLSLLIAFPLAYYLMDIWLMDFAYRIGFSALPYLIAGFSAIAIAIITISLQAMRAAIRNPVEVLKYE